MPGPTPPTAPTIALVDDDAALRHALVFAFETAGFCVRAFDSADPAYAAAAQDWACLVLDQRLVGETGLDLLRRLRARGVRAPALIITTNPSAQTIADAADAGVEIVEKPLLGETLISKVNALIARQP